MDRIRFHRLENAGFAVPAEDDGCCRCVIAQHGEDHRHALDRLGRRSRDLCAGFAQCFCGRRRPIPHRELVPILLQ